MGVNWGKIGRGALKIGGGIGGFIAGGPAGAAAGYQLGGMIGGDLSKKKRPQPGQPDPYDVAEQQSLGELKGAMGNREGDAAVRSTEAGQSIDTVGRGGASNVAGWSPRRTDGTSTTIRERSRSIEGVDTSQLKNWRNEKLDGYVPGVSSYKTRDLVTDAGSGLRSEIERSRNNAAGTPQLQGDVDVSSVEGFDAGGAVAQYAKGAWDSASIGLKDQLEALSYDAAGRHRMKSGWFDADQGRVVRDTAMNLQGQIAQQAVNAAGITAEARGRGASLRVQRAGDRDRAAIDAAGLATDRDRMFLDATGKIDELRSQGRIREAEMEYEALSDSDKLRLEAASEGGRQRLSALDSGTRAEIDRAGKADSLDLEGRTAADRLDFDRARTADAMDFERASYIDTDRRTRDTDVMRGRLGREEHAGGRADRASDRYYDWQAGGLDRRQAAKNANAQQKQNRRQQWLDAGKVGLDVWNTYKGRGRPVGNGAATGRPPIENGGWD